MGTRADAVLRNNIRLRLWVPAFAGTTSNKIRRDGHRERRSYFVSGQPLSLAVKNALSPGMVASCL